MSFLETDLERKYLNLFIRFLFKNEIYEEYLEHFKEGNIKIHEVMSPQQLIGSMRLNDLKWFKYYHDWRDELSKLNKLEKINNDSARIIKRD